MRKVQTKKVRLIYAIYINRKCYIGSTDNIYFRKKKHLADLRRNKHHAFLLQRAYNKYGESFLKFKILEIIKDCDNILVREQYFIDTIKPFYNSCKIVGKTRLGQKATPQHSANMSKSLMGRVSPMKGKKFTESHKENLSKAHQGKPKKKGWHHTQKSIELMQERRKNPLGRITTEKQKEKARINLRKWRKALSQKQLDEIIKKRKENYCKQRKALGKTCKYCK